MQEIKQAKCGIDYAEPHVLKRKQRVYSSAMLMRIPHNDPSKEDISLKIGRYNILNGVETNNPKSEMTLDNDELNELIQYIEKNYTPVSLGSGQYISVQDNIIEAVQKFKVLLEQQNGIAELLIDHGILTENVFIAAMAIQKKQALKSFETELNADHPESFWQKWFQENKWILGSDFAQIITERSIDTENIADYIMRAFDGFVDLVEIKKPNGMPFWATTMDHGNYIPSSLLIKAITQCMNYIHSIEQEANSAKFLDRVGSKVIKPRCILIYGRSNDWNDVQRKAYRILNAAYNQVSIITYDYLVMRAKNIMYAKNDECFSFSDD